ncbi:hypothetical protein SAV14893_089500 [Streptomyces avermitilis]|uniref:Uncharacterized protein n=1 Tax=Streptomyces avermitilis TaxID=33903 RepID=A0A4D4MDT4_STRAX|nr:hypothetical protein SAV14893_089500 [Streptomyces avermitilis]GDY79815.1 hypothetical protein SAV31267_093000 [Streptomyces avermitilis]
MRHGLQPPFREQRGGRRDHGVTAAQQTRIGSVFHPSVPFYETTQLTAYYETFRLRDGNWVAAENLRDYPGAAPSKVTVPFPPSFLPHGPRPSRTDPFVDHM